MLLSKIAITHFKRIDSVTIDLADVTILVGANGCGKSSIMQAIHLACCVMRQAKSIGVKTATVGIDELDYLPTEDYKMLCHNTIWGNKEGIPSSKVDLIFSRESAQFAASCQLRSARNAGISISGYIDPELSGLLRNKLKFFSAYIPGISGIPNKEEMKGKKVILKACSYGDSNIILRNVLLLLKAQNPQNIAIIENWIGQLIGPIRIVVEYDQGRDLTVSCTVEMTGDRRPLELVGTGYLQLIQIFSYILLFEPGILLVNEQDIHLHPNVQEKLARTFARVANERHLRILISTHSPFIVRGSPTSTKVYWLKDGGIESQNRREVELALGWGAFGKKILIISEDEDTWFLRKLIGQWPDIEKFIAFYPGKGYKNLTTPQQAGDLYQALGGKFKVLVHRDRDSLTDDEAQILNDRYEAKGVHLWIPELSDIEAYFCQTSFLTGFLRCTPEVADHYIDGILTHHITQIRNQFNSQRAAHNEELYKDIGGSPANEAVWASFQNRGFKGAKGKYIFKQLKNKISGAEFREDAIQNYTLTGTIALDLKAKLDELLAE